jgi:hypothetical protein
MTLDELREVATKNKSVNVHLASAYDLRWHDPFWLSAWERWCKARAAWDTTWPYVDMVAFRHEEFGVYNPKVELISDATKAAVAREYIEAREAYKAATKLYLSTRPNDDERI